MPAFLSIEPTNICNLQCPECPTGNRSSIVAKGEIELNLCRKIIPQIASHSIFANLYFQGEPMIHKQIIEIIRLASECKILTSISSNAHFITPQNADELVKSGLTKIIISLDGYDQKSYEQYRRNGDFNKVIAGLEALCQAKQKAHSHFPLVEIQCLLFKHTENHKQEIKEIAKKYQADLITFKTAQFYDNQNIAMIPSDRNSRYLVHGNEIEIKRRLKNRCWKMWSSCIVAWNGNVLPCCFDKNHTFTFGNLNSQSLREIWFSEQYKKFRRTISRNRSLIKMCQNCTS